MAWGAGAPPATSEAPVSPEETLAILFQKKPVNVRRTTAADARRSVVDEERARVGGTLPTAAPASSSWLSQWFRRGGASQSSPPPQEVALSAEKSAAESSSTIDWTQLPPCPVQGYELQADGLHDRLGRNNGRPLSAEALKALILETSAIQTKAQYELDVSLKEHFRTRGEAGAEYIVSPTLGCCGLFYLGYVLPRKFRAALPSSSVFFTSSWLRDVVTDRWRGGKDVEIFTRRHRWVLRATNIRVIGSACAGVLLSLLGFGTSEWSLRRSLETTEASGIGKQQVSYQLHTKAAAQWLWTVYFHHPAYKHAATTVVPLSFIKTPKIRK